MEYDLGIDVGTSYTAAAIRRPDGSVEVVGLGPIADNIPTVVYLTDTGTLLAGDAAARRVTIDPSGAAREFKRRMGDPTPIILRTSPFSAESLLRHMVERVVQQVRDRENALPRSTVVTHPANWGPYKLDLFDQALRVAEIGPLVSRLSEPHAAATAYAAQARVPVGASVAVYDLGGGTFDAAVLRKGADGFDLQGESVGIEHLGGVDFDEAVLHHVRSTLGNRWPSDPDDPALPSPMAHLRRACTEAKELLSSEQTVSIPVLLPGVDTTVTLERARFEAMIAPRVEDTLAALDAAIGSAGLTARDLHQIILVGGSSRIPLVARMLRQRFGDLVGSDVDPLFAVAIGAALVAGTRGAAAGTSQNPPPPPSSATPPPPPVAPPPPMAPTIPPPPVDPPRPSGAGGAGGGAPPTPINPPGFIDPLPAPGPRSRRKLVVPAVGLAAALAVGGFLVLRPKDDSNDAGATDTTEASTDDTEAASDAATTVDPTDDTDSSDTTDPEASETTAPRGADITGQMVEIPAGKYGVGSVDKPKVEQIAAPFYLDQYEVTGEQYLAFLNRFSDLDLPKPKEWGSQLAQKLYDRPATGVPYYLADAFCSSVGKRLPTLLEWEIAASGISPSGDALRPAYSWPLSGDSSAQVEGPGELTRLPSVPESYLPPEDKEDDDDHATYDVHNNLWENISPFGARDMTGNAAEWVVDPALAPDSATKRLKGGPSGYALKNWEDLPAADVLRPDEFLYAGFRCAADVPVRIADDAAQIEFAEVEIGEAPTSEEVSRPPAGEIHDSFDNQYYGLTYEAFGGAFEFERWGYHPVGNFHLEAKGHDGSSEDVFALYDGWKLDPEARYRLDVTAIIEEKRTLEGDYQFGVGFSMDGLGHGYVFFVNPGQNGSAELYERFPPADGETQPTYQLIDGVNRGVGKKGDTFTFHIEQNEAGLYDFSLDVDAIGLIPVLSGVSLEPIGDRVGMFLQAMDDSTGAHIHFQSFDATKIG